MCLDKAVFTDMYSDISQTEMSSALVESLQTI